MEQDAKVDIPAWLEKSPTRITGSPVQSRIQDLPFEKLTWEHFELLCLRLIREEADVENCRRYGERGDKQEGIDIYATLKNSEKYNVYQCKREKTFSPTKIKNAVAKFLAGTWVEKTSTFILCTQESLCSKKRSDEIETQREELRKKGISFILWDSQELSIKLKDHPNIVTDFFNEDFSKAFCGKIQVESLSGSSREGDCIEEYQNWILDKTSTFRLPGLPKKFSIRTDLIAMKVCHLSGDTQPFDAQLLTELYEHCVIIGDSGSGKSTFIQRLANELTSEGKKVLLVRLPDVLRLFNQGKTFAEAIIEASIDGLNTNKNLLLSALKNSDYLLADGLDECNNDRVTIAVKLNDWVSGNSKVKVIVSSRNGYAREVLSSWTSVKLQPLDIYHIKNFIKNFLASSVINRLDANKTMESISGLSFLEKSPLLIGFILFLIKSNVNVNQKNRGELYKDVINIACDHISQSNRSIDFNKQSGKRIFKLIGWKLIHNPLMDEIELVDELSQDLFSIGYSRLDSEREAENSIRFWESKCILNRSEFACQNRVGFVHLSLCEFAAAQYALELQEEDFRTWIKNSYEDIKWKESILFACRLGMGEKIVRNLFELFDVTPSSIMVSAIVNSEEISDGLLNKIANQIKLQLKSSSPEIAFDAARNLLDILPKIHNFTFDKDLLINSQDWTRLAAVRIALVCSENDINLEFLIQLIQEISAKPDRITSVILNGVRTIDETGGWRIKNEVIIDGCKLWIKKQQNIKTANKILEIISQDSIIYGTVKAIKDFLICVSLENWLSTENTSQDKKEWLSFHTKVTENDKSWKEILSPQSFSDQLIRFQELEKSKCAYKSLLESVGRAIDISNRITDNQVNNIHLISLGILHKGMGWPYTVVSAWYVLGENIDTEAVDIVLECFINVFDLNRNKLAIEVRQELNRLDRFFSIDFSQIKSYLQGNDISKDNYQVEKDLQEFYNDKSISSPEHGCFPNIPVTYRWENVVEVDFCPDALVRALKHPSEGISQNAMRLIKHGVGGKKALNLAKEFIGEEKWNSLQTDCL
jgi:energy-coupling factor transporter ATP-binding protein EcfA2